MPVDGLHHLRTEQLHFEVGILISESSADHACNCEDKNGQEALVNVSSKSRWVGITKEIKYRRWTRPVARIDGIVGANEQLVDVAGKVDGAAVFVNGRQIRWGVAVEETELLQLGARERFKAARRTLLQQGFEIAPVGFAFFQP